MMSSMLREVALTRTRTWSDLMYAAGFTTGSMAAAWQASIGNVSRVQEFLVLLQAPKLRLELLLVALEV